jgi:hypothetical protein
MDAPTTLGSALEAFIREHEYCGGLDSGKGQRCLARMRTGSEIAYRAGAAVAAGGGASGARANARGTSSTALGT